MAEPQFDALENFRRIEMDKGTTYVVVEGTEVDVFDSVLREILGQKHNDIANFVVVSGSDKITIVDFLNSSSVDNFFVVLDRDFDLSGVVHPRALSLGRYSIENYCFDDLVVKRVLARVAGKSIVSVQYSSKFLLDYYCDNLSSVLGLVRSYQMAPGEKPFSWSDRRLLKKDCWSVDADECNKLINDISSFFGGSDEDCRDCLFSADFPGKMIVSGIYFYVKNKLGLAGFSKVYNNYSVFSGALLSFLGYSKDFCNDLAPVANFVRNNERN